MLFLGLLRMFVYLQNIILCPLIHILVPILFVLSFHQALFSSKLNDDPYSGNGSFWIIMISSSVVGHLILKLRGPAVMKHLTGNLIASFFGLIAYSAGESFNCICGCSIFWHNEIHYFANFLIWVPRGVFSGISVSNFHNI